MKTNLTKYIFIALLFLICHSLFSQENSSPPSQGPGGFTSTRDAKIGNLSFRKNSSAVLELESTSKGFLPPRMTNAQKSSIENPATGLIIYCTNCGPSGEYQVFNGTYWVNFAGGNANKLICPTLTNITYSVSTNTITLTSSVTNEGTYSVTARGFVYSLSPNPKIDDANSISIITSANSGIGIFSSTISSLLSGSDYYVSAFATSDAGTMYGNSILVATTGTKVPTIVSATGRVWMDRNLGASRVALNSTDTDSYGDLYQWGRRTDGHQSRSSSKYGNGFQFSSSNEVPPGYSNLFIVASSAPNDWRSPQNSNLWQGVNGINNPCPSGFRLPTSQEFAAEVSKYNISNAEKAFESALLLPIAGMRESNTALLSNSVNSNYWTSTTSGSFSKRATFTPNSVILEITAHRAYGMSVRCIRN
jgi:uncharacterized protein (TIGR02145 family)